MKLKGSLKLKKIAEGLKKAPIKRPVVSHSSLIRDVLLVMIMVIAFGVRLLPVRWGMYLSEFDPYYQYRQARYIVDHGYLGWTQWHDYMSWYPSGNMMPQTSYPGVGLAIAGLYTFLNALGIRIVQQPSLDPLLSDPVYNVAVIFPVIMGTVTCLVMYFLGRDLGGESVGIFAALFLALDSSYIGRTSLGFCDDETVGIFSMLLVIIFFMRSIDLNRPMKAGLFYAVGAGLFLGYLSASWGASRYPIVMVALFALVLLAMKRYSPRLLLAYAVTFGLALSMTVAIPYFSKLQLDDTSLLPVYGVLFLLCITEFNRRVKKPSRKLIYALIFVALLAAAFVFLWSRGIITPLQAKFLSVIDPYQRLLYPLVESVAEHRPSAWGTFYYNFGLGVFFLPLGLFFAVMMASNLSVFLVIYSLTGLYFASSMIRLNIILAPAVCLLWALALTRLLKPFILSLKENPQTGGHKTRFGSTVGKELIGAVLIVIFMLFTFTYVIGTDFTASPEYERVRVFAQSYSPTTIAASSMPLKPSSMPSDWLKALDWMRNYLPDSPSKPGQPGTVVACWWDYGDWITIIGNKTTLVDNTTLNSTQIKQVALMFMSSEDDAINILKKYNVTHVVVFTTVHYYGYDMPWGETGKFKWMIKIANLNETDFGQDAYSQQVGSYWQWSSYGQTTTLYKMMTYGKYALGITLIDGAGNSISPVYLDHFSLVYPTSTPKAINGAYYALVLVYEVEY
jgi:dolichyl-diphosphooligosaccharide--protein glycosyltransferase